MNWQVWRQIGRLTASPFLAQKPVGEGVLCTDKVCVCVCFSLPMAGSDCYHGSQP